MSKAMIKKKQQIRDYFSNSREVDKKTEKEYNSRDKKNAGKKGALNDLTNAKISWPEFLFNQACVTGNDICINLLQDYPLIQLYPQNIHLGFAQACRRGRSKVAKQLYSYSKTHIGLDLYDYHWCDPAKKRFCLGKQACSCHSYRLHPNSLLDYAIDGDHVELLQWCAELAASSRYTDFVFKLEDFYDMNLNDVAGRSTTFVRCCKHESIQIAQMIYQYNLSTNSNIYHFPPSSFRSLCKYLLQRGGCLDEIIILLTTIFVTHYDNATHSDEIGDIDSEEEGITSYSGSEEEMDEVSTKFSEIQTKFEVALKENDIPVYEIEQQYITQTAKQLLYIAEFECNDSNHKTKMEVIQQTLNWLLLCISHNYDDPDDLYLEVIQFCIDHQIKLCRETVGCL